VPQQQLDFAEAIQVAPTMASIMGIATPWQAKAMI